MSEALYCENEQRIPFRMRCVSVYHYDDTTVWRYQFIAHDWDTQKGQRPEFTIETPKNEFEVGGLYRLYVSKEVYSK